MKTDAQVLSSGLPGAQLQRLFVANVDNLSYLTSNMPQAHYASQGEFMGARQSAETTSAIRLVLEGRKTVYQAAEMCGIYASTLYRALNRKPKKRVDKKKA